MDHQEMIEFVMDVFAEKMPITKETYILCSLSIQGQLIDLVESYGLLDVFVSRLSDIERHYVWWMTECLVSLEESENLLDQVTRHYYEQSGGRQSSPPEKPPQS